MDAVLDFKPQLAAKIMEELKDFPLVLTRSLETARTWLRRQTRGLRRCGLMASSGALRLRADGIEISPTFRQGNRELYLDWFLKEPPDIRSSNQLEIAATERECRGLELDWTGLCWGGDVVVDEKSERWLFREFDGRDWETLKASADQAELLGRYRTLLSRAREGMVIWIPEGSEFDRTRSREDFEHTAAYLASCGVQTL